MGHQGTSALWQRLPVIGLPHESEVRCLSTRVSAVLMANGLLSVHHKTPLTPSDRLRYDLVASYAFALPSYLLALC